MYEINKAAVIGAGTMGLGIAGQLANAGIDVLLLDDNQPGLTHLDNLERITIGNIEDELDKIADIDWIAEAIVERLLRSAIDAVLGLADGYGARRHQPLAMPGREVWREMRDWLAKALGNDHMTSRQARNLRWLFPAVISTPAPN